MLEIAATQAKRLQPIAIGAAEPRLRRIALLGNFPPRRCGIATFTADLHRAFIEDVGVPCDVYAMREATATYAFPKTVTFAIRDDNPPDYREAARRINHSNADLVCIQHEYGIFGGSAGEYLLQFLDQLTKPVVTTLHTILAEPNPDQRRVMDRIIRRSSKIIVMTKKGRELLREVHAAPAATIAIVPHGAPDRPLLESNVFKARHKLSGRDVLFTFGLLSPGKGLQSVIKALPAVKERHPNVLYVVLGATHPHLIARQGESYREGLEKLAADLGVEDNVQFINQYTDTDRLIDFIGAADIYITPYLNESQITSGTLSYAVALGKPIISTPYWHASEVLDGGRGVLVPFNDPAALAESINRLLDNPGQRMSLRQNAYAAGRETIWPRVASRYASIMRDVIPNEAPATHMEMPSIAMPSLDGVSRLTDSCGMAQHTILGVVDRNHGYCLDDNARALILMNRIAAAGQQSRRTEDLALAYAAFMQHAWNEDERTFRNFLSYNRTWLEAAGSQDSSGRAFWALGDTVASSTAPQLKAWASGLAVRALDGARGLAAPRARAFAILGFCGLLGPRNSGAVLDGIVAHARVLQGMLAGRKKTSWPWFEDYLSYDNARLPQALIVAGMSCGDTSLVDDGVAALAWLCERQTSDAGHFQPVGTESFECQRAIPEPFDQQPVEAAATIDAALAAFGATGNANWRFVASKAYNWFLGENALGRVLADPKTGICHDGLARDGINLNQGAEAVLSFGLASAAMFSLGRSERRSKMALV